MSNNDPKMSNSKMKPTYHLTSVLKSGKHSTPISLHKFWLILWLNTDQNGIATVLPLTNNPLSVYDAT